MFRAIPHAPEAVAHSMEARGPGAMLMLADPVKCVITLERTGLSGSAREPELRQPIEHFQRHLRVGNLRVGIDLQPAY